MCLRRSIGSLEYLRLRREAESLLEASQTEQSESHASGNSD
jgi:hypothetical protein